MNDKELTKLILDSWRKTENTLCTIDEVKEWIRLYDEEHKVEIRPTVITDDSFWYYDKQLGVIKNRSNSFFSISGLKVFNNDNSLVCEQPVIVQPEIGYLGMICKVIDGTLYFLIQAKIEPGNVNKIQLSPTLQATKSNFQQKHGGKKPAYVDYFLGSKRYQRIVDQIQSEQSQRFYGKRNRNAIILVQDDINVLPSFKWLTLGQIKMLMQFDNLVNMDTRTVISCLPFYNGTYSYAASFDLFFKKLIAPVPQDLLPNLFCGLNDIKEFLNFEKRQVPLENLESWHWKNGEFVCNNIADFSVIYCNIAIDGREVKEWQQPLFKAAGTALFALAFCETESNIEFLIRLKPEAGCFDVAEFGPSLQFEPTFDLQNTDQIEQKLLSMVKENKNIVADVLLSEEGGRFYHEQNRNILLKVSKEDIGILPKNWFWVDFMTLNTMIKFNNVLNIQLRNLLAILP